MTEVAEITQEIENRMTASAAESLETIFCELRGLLKEHAQFPEMWDTDERLREWLKGMEQL